MKHKKHQQAKQKRLLAQGGDIKETCQNCMYQTNNPSTCSTGDIREPSFPTPRKGTCENWRFK